MLGTGSTYFSREQSLDGHYIVVGDVKDIYCGDSIYPMKDEHGFHRELAIHLRTYGNFRAVVFMDGLKKVYCYDVQSWRFLSRKTEPCAADDVRNDCGNGGPLGFRVRKRVGETEQRKHDESGTSKKLAYHDMEMERAWGRIKDLMLNRSVRCAYVFPNADSLHMSFPDDMLQVLEELSAGETTNHSVAVYCFSRARLHELQGNDPNAGNGTPAWNKFYTNVLKPRINADDEAANRVLKLPPPNALEIQNYLLALSADGRPIEMMDIPALADDFAYFCVQKGYDLRSLQAALEENFFIPQPGRKLTSDCWKEAVGAHGFKSAMEMLNDMIGLDDIKEKFRAKFEILKEYGEDEKKRTKMYPSRFSPPPMPRAGIGHELNMLLMGPPGTGKTTVARLIGRLYLESGMLPKGQTVYREGKDFIKSNQGDSAKAVHDAVLKARGGVLFIDEAYVLYNEDPNSRDHANTITSGQEALDQLTADMSTYEGQFAVVLAGYKDKIMKLVKYGNEGLSGRFPNDNRYELRDYSPDEMRQILLRCAKANGVSFDKSLTEPMLRPNGKMRSVLDDFCDSWRDVKSGEWHNAREATELISLLKPRYQARMIAAGRRNQECEGFTADDFPESYEYALRPRSENLSEVAKRIDDMIGLDNVKKFLRSVISRQVWTDNGGGSPGTFVFYGPPGSGKTHVARLIGDSMRLLGITQRRHVTECKAADLMKGENPEADLDDVIKSARGGILFIDEAHQLNDENRPYGQRILRALVPIIDDPKIRSDTCFILAGYQHEMRDLLEADDGLNSRIPQQRRISFMDYKPNELVKILEIFAKEQGFACDQGYKDRSEVALKQYLMSRPANFGNARYMRETYLPASIDALNRRLNRLYGVQPNELPEFELARSVSMTVRHTLTAADIPEEFDRTTLPNARPDEEYDAFEELERVLIGKESVKKFAKRFSPEKEGEPRFMDSIANRGMCYSIIGPNGSGKETVVHLMAGIFRERGWLETDYVTVGSRGNMVSQYVGGTPETTRKVVNTAINGTLAVINPSSMLGVDNGRDYGPEALAMLQSEMAAHRNNTSFVFVDSEEGMEAFLQAYPGIAAMITERLCLSDMEPGELLELFRRHSLDSFTFTDEVEGKLGDFFKNWRAGAMARNSADWSNGDEVVKLIGELRDNWALTEGRQHTNETPPRRIITKEMFPARLQRYFSQADNWNVLPAKVDPKVLNTQPQTNKDWKSVVVFLEILQNGHHAGSGTGFLISEDGLILTNNHVVNGAEEIRAWLHLPGIPGDRAIPYPCTRTEMKRIHDVVDMALLKIDGSGFPCVSIMPPNEKPLVGAEIYCYSFPLGIELNGGGDRGDPATLNPTLSQGNINSYQKFAWEEICYCDVGGAHGSSGAPVFDKATNRVIGVFSGAVADKSQKIVVPQNLMHEIRYFWDVFAYRSMHALEETEDGYWRLPEE